MTTTTHADRCPILGRITRHNGAGGQVAYSVLVTYPGEPTAPVWFIGSVYGSPGPVVMVTGAGQTQVTEPGRFGDLSPTWVRRFFGQEA
jgi:hypothetical protein